MELNFLCLPCQELKINARFSKLNKTKEAVTLNGHVFREICKLKTFGALRKTS